MGIAPRCASRHSAVAAIARGRRQTKKRQENGYVRGQSSADAGNNSIRARRAGLSAPAAAGTRVSRRTAGRRRGRSFRLVELRGGGGYDRFHVGTRRAAPGDCGAVERGLGIPVGRGGHRAGRRVLGLGHDRRLLGRHLPLAAPSDGRSRAGTFLQWRGRRVDRRDCLNRPGHLEPGVCGASGLHSGRYDRTGSGPVLAQRGDAEREQLHA